MCVFSQLDAGDTGEGARGFEASKPFGDNHEAMGNIDHIDISELLPVSVGIKGYCGYVF